MKRAILLLALTSFAACKRRVELEPPAVHIATSSASEWIVKRTGTSPAFATRDGSTWIFIEPAFHAETRRLPGISLGDQRGPRLGLLAGYFSPLIGLSSSQASEETWIALEQSSLTVRFGGELTAHISPSPGGARFVLDGSAVLLPPADRAEIRTRLGDAPAAAFKVTASDDPRVYTPKADRLQITGERQGTLVVAAECARITTPTSRGSTSVFVVSLGPAATEGDPLYGVADAAPHDASCAPSRTATVTVDTRPPAPEPAPE